MTDRSSSDMLVASSDTIASEVGGEVVLINIASGAYFGLDTVGSEIWRRLQTPLPLAELTAQLQRQFDGEPTTIADEADAFVAKLVELGLLTRTPAG